MNRHQGRRSGVSSSLSLSLSLSLSRLESVSRDPKLARITPKRRDGRRRGGARGGDGQQLFRHELSRLEDAERARLLGQDVDEVEMEVRTARVPRVTAPRDLLPRFHALAYATPRQAERPLHARVETRERKRTRERERERESYACALTNHRTRVCATRGLRAEFARHAALAQVIIPRVRAVVVPQSLHSL